MKESHFHVQLDMLRQVAEALGPELREQVTFVGGCTTGLLLTDKFAREQVRSTDDVDLIVHVMGYPAYMALQKQLRQKGFREVAPTPGEPMPICAMKLGELRVDFMPDDGQILGFTNRWYQKAMETATEYGLGGGLSINLVSPVYFIATKLEAYNGRGGGDALASRDIEDLLNLLDGRNEIVEEVRQAPAELREFIRQELDRLMDDDNFQYAVQSQCNGAPERETRLFNRLMLLTRGAG